MDYTKNEMNGPEMICFSIFTEEDLTTSKLDKPFEAAHKPNAVQECTFCKKQIRFVLLFKVVQN